ncbi:MAG: protein kinase [Myxococcales bacterium]|nr:protein kinase [Myxococcales bacterium]
MSSPLDHHDDPLAAQNPADLSGADPEPGARIGAYEVVRAVARGGMATVLEVRDTRNEQRLALKLLLPLAHADEARSRFRREFRALSRLNHPNVLRVHEWGLIGDRPWFSMELVGGRDLRDELGHLAALQPEDRFARVELILKQVTRALAYIHERGMVHRDVTPGNIMVLPDGTAKIMDFGVVKEMGADLTAVGEVIGTVAWMAPEQITSTDLDARADLYSLGCVLYLLLTGKRPFSAHTIHGFMEKHLHEVPVPPRQVDPLVPAHLDAICNRLLQKKPADRYASATHLLHVLGDPTDALDMDEWPPRTVGRGPLRARMRDTLDDVEQHGLGGAILITGANGQGKTRLLEAGLNYARRLGLRVARGRSRREDRPFGAFFGIYEKLERPVPVPLLDQVFRGETPPERYPVLAAFRDLLLANAPVVVALDDLEHADAATVELLTYLIRNTLELASEPVVFLLSHEAPEEHVLREVGALPPVHTETLEPLGASEVEELVVSVLGNGTASLALAGRIHAESSGSPAFIADMLRGLLDDGLIVRNDDRYEIVVDAAEITRSRLPMPASLRQALKERIAPLSAEALEVGRVIALARRRIDLDVLVEVVDLDEDEAMEGLDELVDAQIVVEDRDADVERVELSHSRFHDVLLESLTAEARAGLHRRMGEALERHYRGRLGPRVEELAFHFQAAGLATKAYAFLQLSIERHVRQSLFGEAMALIGRALEIEPTARPYLLLDDADTQLVQLFLQRSMAEHAVGQTAAALASLREAEKLADVVGEPGLQSRVATELGTRLRGKGEHGEGLRQLERAVDKAREAGDQTLLPGPLYHQGSHAWMSGDLDRALGLWRESLSIATTVGDERNAAWANNGLGIGHTCAGASLSCRKHFEQSARQMEALGMVGPLSIIRCNLAEVYLSTGILRKALDQIDRAVAQSREVGHVHGVAVGLMWRANAFRVLRRMDDASRTISDTLKYCRHHGIAPDELSALLVKVELSLDSDRPDEALEALERARPLLDRYDNEGQRHLVDAWHAVALAKLGREEEAAAVLAGKQPPQEPWQNTQVRTDLAWAQAFRLLGRREEALALLERASDSAERIGYRLYQLLVRQELFELADGEEAARHARIANSLARSLAANLPREDGKTFLARGWGEA